MVKRNFVIFKELSIYIIKILLIVLICFLSGYDAPEFVHCGHIWLCEFLEVPCVVGNCCQVDHSVLGVNQKRENTDCPARYNFPDDPQWFIKKEDRYINPHRDQRLLLLPRQSNNKIIVYQPYSFRQPENCLPSQTLQIINISIMKS